MFGKMIYYDEKTVADYYSYATRKIYSRLQNQSQESGINASLNVLSASAGVSKSNTSTYQMTTSLLLECKNFEKELVDRDDYLDFTTHDEFDIDSAERGTIIKFIGFIDIPEQFDMVQTLDRFKPFLMESINKQDWEEQNKNIAQTLFNGAGSFSIPLIFELAERTLCAKIKKENLLVSYDEIEEITEDEVTVLARISSGVITPENAIMIH